MKKMIVLSLLAAVMLTACGKQPETAATETEPTQVVQPQETRLEPTETQASIPSEEPEQIPETQPPETETAEAAPEYPGVYCRTSREEIDGTICEKDMYIVLNEDHTGYVILQEIGTLTWDENQLTETIGVTYDIALTQEDGTVNLMVYDFQDENGNWIPCAYEKIEALPADIAAMLPVA